MSKDKKSEPLLNARKINQIFKVAESMSAFELECVIRGLHTLVNRREREEKMAMMKVNQDITRGFVGGFSQVGLHNPANEIETAIG